MAEYRMETLLKMRDRAEEEAKQAFAGAMQALVKEKKELERLQADLEQRKLSRKAKVLAYLDEITLKGTGVSGMSAMGRYEERLKDEEAQLALEIENQKEQVKAAERELEQKRQEMAHAAMEHKAMQKHKEKWAQQRKAERDTREDLAQEEIGNTLHLARTRRQG